MSGCEHKNYPRVYTGHKHGFHVMNGEVLWKCVDCGKLIRKPTFNRPGEISDGYHTFDELYDHRMALTAALVNTNPDICWKSWNHHDPENDPMFDGMFIVGIETPTGTATYHYDAEHWNKFRCKEVENAPMWDGHTPSDAMERILTL